MRVEKISNISYKGKIIDAHAHIGKYCGKVYNKDNLDVFIKSELPNKDRVEKMFVSALDVLTSEKDEYAGNKDALNILGKDECYKVLASCTPGRGSVENIKKLFCEVPHGFIGLKFHPSVEGLELSDERYKPYLEFAVEKQIPCLFHSAVSVDEYGHSIPYANDISAPEKLYELAKKYKTPFVLAHLGAGHDESHDRTIQVLVDSIKNGDADLYADISWVDIGSEHYGNYPQFEYRSKEHILKAIKRLKGIGDADWKYGDQSYRLMFGTDAPIDRFSNDDAITEYTVFVEDLKHAIRNDNDLKFESEQIIDNLFYHNANKLFLSKNKQKTPSVEVLAGIPGMYF